MTTLTICRAAALRDLKPLRAELIARCKEWGLKGTILLSPEGVSLAVAGTAACVDLLLARLRAVPGLAGLEPQADLGESQPFARLLVRLDRTLRAVGPADSVMLAEGGGLAGDCYGAASMAERIAIRQRAIASAATPLPGAKPYQNRRPLNISAAYDGCELLAFLCDRLPQIAPAEWVARCAAGRFTSDDGEVLTATRRLSVGERVWQWFPAAAEPPVATDIRLLFEDQALIVIDKPAPLPMHPSGRFNLNTLQYLLNLAYAPERPRPLHRLDANTSGLVAFARTRHCCHLVQRQFLEGTVDKRYLVRVAGHPAADAFSCCAAISAAPGVLGTHAVDDRSGRPARTDFRVRERSGDGTALLEARLGTGRTNQIRIHLWQLGHPVIGDPAYLPGGRIGDTQTLDPAAPPLMLQAWRLAFRHPLSGELLQFESARGLPQHQCASSTPNRQMLVPSRLSTETAGDT